MGRKPVAIMKGMKKHWPDLNEMVWYGYLDQFNPKEVHLERGRHGPVPNFAVTEDNHIDVLWGLDETKIVKSVRL